MNNHRNTFSNDNSHYYSKALKFFTNNFDSNSDSFNSDSDNDSNYNRHYFMNSDGTGYLIPKWLDNFLNR